MRLNLAAGTLAGVLSVAIAGCGGGGGSSNAVAPVRTTGASGCASSAPAALYVAKYTDQGTGWATYPLSAAGSTSPQTNVVDQSKTINVSLPIAVDALGRVYVETGKADLFGGTGIAEFCTQPSAINPTPLRSLAVPGVTSIAVDVARHLYAVASVFTSSGTTSQILEFAPDTAISGNVASPASVTPLRTIGGLNTGLDSAFTEFTNVAANATAVYAQAADASIVAFGPTANGNVPPTFRLTAARNTGFYHPAAAARDSAGNVYIHYDLDNRTGKNGGSVVAVYAPGQYSAPVRTVPDSDALNVIATDAAGQLYELGYAPNVMFLDVYAANATANSVPTARYTLQEPYATEPGVAPVAMAIDAAGRIYIGDDLGNYGVVIYDTSGHFLGRITPSPGGIGGVLGLAVDPASQQLIVQSEKQSAGQTAGLGLNALEIFPAGTITNVPPSRIIDDGEYVGQPLGNTPIALDAAGNIYVRVRGLFTSAPATVIEYAAASSTSAQPISTFFDPLTFGDNSVDYFPDGFVLDGNGNLVVTDYFGGNAFVYLTSTTGNAAAPVASYGVVDAGLAAPEDPLALDSNGTLYVVDSGRSILVFPPNATTPSRTIAGWRTRMWLTQSIAVNDAGEIFVATPDAVLVFAPGASGNVAPSRWLFAAGETGQIAIGPGPAIGGNSTQRSPHSVGAGALRAAPAGPDAVSTRRAVQAAIARLCATRRAYAGSPHGHWLDRACTRDTRASDPRVRF